MAKSTRSAGAGARPVQTAKPRPAKRSRKGFVGGLTTVVLVAAAAAAGLFLAKNSSTRNLSIGGQKVAVPAEGPAGGPVAVRDLGPAPRFAIRTLSGRTFSLDPRRGPVVLSFIAGWCSSCLGEAAAGGELVRAFRRFGLRVLAIDADPNDSVGQLRQFIAAAGNPPIQFAMDRTSKVTLAYRVRALDTTVIVDRNGRMVYRDEYPTEYATLASVVTRLVGSSVSAARRASPPPTGRGG